MNISPGDLVVVADGDVVQITKVVYETDIRTECTDGTLYVITKLDIRRLATLAEKTAWYETRIKVGTELLRAGKVGLDQTLDGRLTAEATTAICANPRQYAQKYGDDEVFCNRCGQNPLAEFVSCDFTPSIDLCHPCFERISGTSRFK